MGIRLRSESNSERAAQAQKCRRGDVGDRMHERNVVSRIGDEEWLCVGISERQGAGLMCLRDRDRPAGRDQGALFSIAGRAVFLRIVRILLPGTARAATTAMDGSALAIRGTNSRRAGEIGHAPCREDEHESCRNKTINAVHAIHTLCLKTRLVKPDRPSWRHST